MTDGYSVNTTKHSHTTRIVHAGLAIAIITQLTTSLVMVKPGDGPENVWFEVHEYLGLTAFALAFAFWLTLFFREQGSQPGLLFPWFSGARRKALAEDVKRHVRDLTRFKLTPYEGARRPARRRPRPWPSLGDGDGRDGRDLLYRDADKPNWFELRQTRHRSSRPHVEACVGIHCRPCRYGHNPPFRA